MEIVFAPQDRWERVAHLWPRFAREILQTDEGAFISDESRLTDFWDGLALESMVAKEISEVRAASLRWLETVHEQITTEYFVDARAAGNSIVDVLETLAQHGVTE